MYECLPGPSLTVVSVTFIRSASRPSIWIIFHGPKDVSHLLQRKSQQWEHFIPYEEKFRSLPQLPLAHERLHRYRCRYLYTVIKLRQRSTLRYPPRCKAFVSTNIRALVKFIPNSYSQSTCGSHKKVDKIICCEARGIDGVTFRNHERQNMSALRGIHLIAFTRFDRTAQTSYRRVQKDRQIDAPMLSHDSVARPSSDFPKFP